MKRNKLKTSNSKSPLTKTGEKNIPNADTLAAMNELKAGNGKVFNSVEQLFKSI